jgi:hypothetical protein
MKKSIIVLVSLLVLCFAVTSVIANAAPQKQKPVPHKTFVGTIDSVTVGDAAAGTKSEMAVTNEAKQQMKFAILPKTTLHDDQGKTTTLDKFKAGDKVTVRYLTTADGTNEALSIKLVK